ncbi:MAG: hypothetical protein MJ202_10025, partial [Lentisphaeria bacterium]|nr:hypothetical protein [Lentisphaeria bacterium]
MMKSVHSRLLAFLTVFLSISLAEAGESPDFAAKQMLAGKANLLNDGFTVSRPLGTANFSPELRLPVQLVYDSTVDGSGLFGHAWRCPQLESAVEATETVLVWTTPWGERVAIPRTRGADGKELDIQAPHSDWRLAPGSSWEDGLKHGNWSIRGLERYSGWRFEYRNGRLASVRSDAGTALEFGYSGDGGLSVSQNGRAFIVLHAQDGTVSLIKINGVEYSIAYVTGTATKAPQVQEEPAGKVQVRLLQSVRTAELLPETFRYDDGGVLAETRRGEAVETFVAERQSPEEYRAQLEARRDGTEYLGPAAGRLLEAGDHRSSYPSEEGRTVTLLRKDDGAAAVFALDRALGRLKTVSFSGATRIGYYAMNPASASLGMLRKVTDGEGRVLASFRR